MTIIAVAALFGAVNFVECEKCPDRMRISEDGRTAKINTARIDPAGKEAMAARAELPRSIILLTTDSRLFWIWVFQRTR